jgi:hypothetical protein
MKKPCSGRIPATPLITHDPSFSVWSFSDHLRGDYTRHWTGYIRGMGGMARIDGKAWSWMAPSAPDRMEQISSAVYPTRTEYIFQAGGVQLTVTFLSPLLPDDLDVLSRPVGYVNFAVESVDGKTHRVELYLDVGMEWATDVFDQPVLWMRQRIAGLQAMRAGTQAQHVLSRSGDDQRYEWGYLWLAAKEDPRVSTGAGADQPMRRAFIEGRPFPDTDDLAQPRPIYRGYPKLAIRFDLGRVTRTGAEAQALIAYEDIYCCEYMQRKLRPYWQRGEATMADLLQTAVVEYPDLAKRSAAFDARLLRDAEQLGGPEYRDLCALSYRQAIAAHKLAADFDGTPMFFSKENFSNGCIATVDVTYPSAPLFLLTNPRLLEAMLTPVLNYARSPRWRFPFAPHDLGTFPLANGQIYGGGELSDKGQMPVEESGNMLLLVAAYCDAVGDASYAGQYWKSLSDWAGYLETHGFDPVRQLCTDDFAGHLAHNANLSIKSILALAAYGKLAAALGHSRVASRFTKLARTLAVRWQRMAEDGDHYRLVFDQAGTWSQKYNLVWDKLLDLNVFPDKVARREVAYYLGHQEKYGLSLDNRKKYGKIDWIVWSGTLAETKEQFRAFLKPLALWLKETSSRVPLPDLYMTDTGEHVIFRARSVVGGVFMRILADAKCRARWEKTWRQADTSIVVPRSEWK